MCPVHAFVFSFSLIVIQNRCANWCHCTDASVALLIGYHSIPFRRIFQSINLLQQYIVSDGLFFFRGRDSCAVVVFAANAAAALYYTQYTILCNSNLFK